MHCSAVWQSSEGGEVSWQGHVVSQGYVMCVETERLSKTWTAADCCEYTLYFPWTCHPMLNGAQMGTIISIFFSLVPLPFSVLVYCLCSLPKPLLSEAISRDWGVSIKTLWFFLFAPLSWVTLLIPTFAVGPGQTWIAPLSGFAVPLVSPWVKGLVGTVSFSDTHRWLQWPL